jgi:hypothetical protein
MTNGNGRSDWQAIKACMKIGTGPYVWVSDGEVHWDDIREDIRPEMEKRKTLVRTRTVKDAVDYLMYKTVPLSRSANERTNSSLIGGESSRGTRRRKAPW